MLIFNFYLKNYNMHRPWQIVITCYLTSMGSILQLHDVNNKVLRNGTQVLFICLIQLLYLHLWWCNFNQLHCIWFPVLMICIGLSFALLKQSCLNACKQLQWMCLVEPEAFIKMNSESSTHKKVSYHQVRHDQPCALSLIPVRPKLLKLKATSVLWIHTTSEWYGYKPVQSMLWAKFCA